MSAGEPFPQSDTGYNPFHPFQANPSGGVITAWQPPQGWDIYVGDGPSPWQPWPPQVYPETPSQRIPDNCQIITTTDTRSLWLSQNHERIAALEAEVKRLRHECKRLQRRLATSR